MSTLLPHPPWDAGFVPDSLTALQAPHRIHPIYLLQYVSRGFSRFWASRPAEAGSSPTDADADAATAPKRRSCRECALFICNIDCETSLGCDQGCLRDSFTHARSSRKSSLRCQFTHRATAEEGKDEGDEKNNPEPSGPHSPWPAMEMLKLSATYRHTEPHYLAFKERDKWWSSSKFPRVCVLPRQRLSRPACAG